MFLSLFKLQIMFLCECDITKKNSHHTLLYSIVSIQNEMKMTTYLCW